MSTVPSFLFTVAHICGFHSKLATDSGAIRPGMQSQSEPVAGLPSQTRRNPVSDSKPRGSRSRGHPGIPDSPAKPVPDLAVSQRRRRHAGPASAASPGSSPLALQHHHGGREPRLSWVISVHGPLPPWVRYARGGRKPRRVPDGRRGDTGTTRPTRGCDEIREDPPGALFSRLCGSFE